MSDRSLADLAEKMRDIDFTMLSTRTAGGAIGARPMSNNREVDYDGDSYYFTYDDALMVADIQADRHVGLGFQGKSGMIRQRPFFVAVEGVATLVHDQGRFAEHWSKDLDRWFPQGIDMPGLVMIHVHAERVHYWDGEDEGEIRVKMAAA
ncbi:pyridoxamine 5'-phosphate oxidase family protein [Rhizorhabdus dicambivorans]|uniref:Pyridoxamine 5'-phosphate oxidase n=1 Tax=Rhizorhabdus dicambivorans TaxID=1850238 RepID=A0A2A4FZR4_9SPHN|nr:pyridoxamine 5'-phosphate oxidase family protein [Rhizorhabdus dicambivorans]ATE63064.1 pyridoxamine 5'-phosphate oxidase [Rhizorhabdus dicambivorans]PCE43241.1 pyridoxamine 5'-phosphate oxidase [Rhizorhabdus dicambivorans]